MAQEDVTLFTVCKEFLKTWSIESDEKKNPIFIQKQVSQIGKSYRVSANTNQYPLNELIFRSFGATLISYDIKFRTHKKLGFEYSIYNMAWWKKNQYLIVATNMCRILIIQWSEFTERYDYVAPTKILTIDRTAFCSLLVYEEIDQLLSGDNNGVIRLWDLNTGQEIKQFNGHDAEIWYFYKLHKNLFMSIANDACIKFWDKTTGKCVQTVDGGDGFVNKLLYSMDEKVLISSNTCKIKIWNLKIDEMNNEVQCTIGFVVTLPFECTAVTFLNDERRLLAADSSGDMFIINVKTGEIISKQKSTHLHSVYGLIVSYRQPPLSYFQTKLLQIQKSNKLSDTNVIA